MIISPPYLPSAQAAESDEEFLDRAMMGVELGKFPLSFDLNWHGGMHMKAPEENGAALPVRAIADGAIAYFRAPTEVSSDPAHALNYRNQWTDNGCIVLKHETEIGEGENAKVIYYSLYMHLSKINIANPTIGQKIYRKDNLGEAGKIYGDSSLIHFEIIADQSQIAKLVGRTTRELTYQSNNGRTDSCWGDMYYFVPPEVLAYMNPPEILAQVENNSAVAYRCPAMPAEVPVQEGPSATDTPPATVDGYEWAVASQLQNGIFVRMSYEKGSCKLTSYYLTGDTIGSVVDEDAKYEYNLFTTATTLYPQTPSAGYELLRFGRVLGPDLLRPANAAHWRRIKLPGKSGASDQVAWINLNSPTVTKFSDADFPQWQGWHLVDDDTDTDSHCNSPFIRALLNLAEGKVGNTDAVGIATSTSYESSSPDAQKKLSAHLAREIEVNQVRLRSGEMQAKVKRLVCKFPTEWRANDFDTRYGWLLKVGDGVPLTTEKYEQLKKHNQALAFWEAANLQEIESRHWHFNPKEFIATFRKCGWLSLNELIQLLPNNSLRKAGATWLWEDVSLNSASRLLSRTESDAKTRRTDLNKALRKFLINSPIRLACFFGNATQETQWYQKFHEGSPYWYAPWDGRGFLQLTHAGNYIKYWDFLGTPIAENIKQTLRSHTTQANNNRPVDVQGHKSMNDPTHSLSDASTGIPQDVINKRNSTAESSNAAQSAGAYWAWSGAAAQADSYRNSSTSTLRTVQTNHGTRHYYENAAFGKVAATVNLGQPSNSYSSIWGVQARFLAFANAQVILLDNTLFDQSNGTKSSLPENYVHREIPQ